MPRPTNQNRAFKIALENPLKILDDVEEYKEVLVPNNPNEFRGRVLNINGQVGIVSSIKYEPFPNMIFSVTRVYSHKDIITWNLKNA